MTCLLVFVTVGLLTTGAGAYAQIYWARSPTRGLVLKSSGSPANAGGVALPARLLVGDAAADTAGHVPHFSAKFDQTIAWNDWCIEADGGKRGTAVYVNLCTGGQFQRWNWVPDEHGRNMIQLRDSNMCLDVAENKADLHGAPVELEECANRASELWQFQEPFHFPKPNSAHTSALRNVVISLLGFAGLGLLTLSVWLRRPQSRTWMSLARSGDLSLKTGLEGGISLPAPRAASVPGVRPRYSDIKCQLSYGGKDDDDGQEVDLNKERAQLNQPVNPYYKAVVPKLGNPAKAISEFSQTAPKEVIFAMKTSTDQLFGKMPDGFEQSTIATTGTNLASLMFNMQMTGYMLRKAERSKSLQDFMQAAEVQTGALPPVSGKIKVKINPEMEVEVNAAAYMSELRSEVEQLREQLAVIRKEQGENDEASLIQYIQSIGPEGQQELTESVGEEVLVAMSQVVGALLLGLDVEIDSGVVAEVSSLRELFVLLLIMGYQLQGLEERKKLENMLHLDE